MSAGFVSFVFPHQGRTGTAQMQWVEGKTVQRYCQEQPLKLYGLTGKRLTHKMYNRDGKPVKYWYQPKDGDAIVFVQVRKGRN